MVDTITRGATVLHPKAILGWPLTRTGRSVVHALLNTDLVEVTVRPPAPRDGILTTLWWDEASAVAAFDALTTVGGPWVWAVPGVLSSTLTAYVLEASLETAEDSGRRWIIRTTVQEVGP
jgi:hypothetical protein